MRPPAPVLKFEGQPPADRQLAAMAALVRSRESITGGLRWDAGAAGWRVISAVSYPPVDRSISGRVTQHAVPATDGKEDLKRVLRQAGEPVVD